jgi:acyl carrier protein
MTDYKQEVFNIFIEAFDEDIRVSTAQTLADDLGVNFDVEDY